MRIYRYRLGTSTHYGEMIGEDLLARCVRLSPYKFELKRTGHEDRLSEVELLVPVKPSKVVCVGRNYVEHAKELGNVSPLDKPLLFLKPPSCLIPHGAEIILPVGSERVDYEGEIALVISDRCYKINASRAYDYLLGVTAFNDVTARDWQKSDGQWTRAKGMNTFGPCGPYIDTSSAEALRIGGRRPVALTVTTELNGQRVQHGSTEQLVFGFDNLISYVSQLMTLEAGDIIVTGTPAGVGPLKPGDNVSVALNCGPCLENTVVADTPYEGQPLEH
ncbi:fumarylacetoacetate hydrolase family protein [bacterium]|nr:fumarylacetoacetate hydrolase family protein [bacterium]